MLQIDDDGRAEQSSSELRTLLTHQQQAVQAQPQRSQTPPDRGGDRHMSLPRIMNILIRMPFLGAPSPENYVILPALASAINSENGMSNRHVFHENIRNWYQALSMNKELCATFPCHQGRISFNLQQATRRSESSSPKQAQERQEARAEHTEHT
jgi:hypothetical protein